MNNFQSCQATYDNLTPEDFYGCDTSEEIECIVSEMEVSPLIERVEAITDYLNHLEGDLNKDELFIQKVIIHTLEQRESVNIALEQSAKGKRVTKSAYAWYAKNKIETEGDIDYDPYEDEYDTFDID